jgi:hypothetical protein
MPEKFVIFAFNGEVMCFAHALLNAREMHSRGMEVRVVIEGSATRAVKRLTEPERPFSKLYLQVRDAGLIDGVCKACATTMGSLKSASQQSLVLLDEMDGHPSMARYIEDGWTVLSF